MAAIDHELAAVGSAGPGCAVVALRVRDLREVALLHGGECGERMEAAVGKMIQASLRPGDQVFQSGDETFVAILAGACHRNHVLLAAARLVAAARAPLSTGLGMPPWQARLAMGIALFPQDGADADGLWRAAQAAADRALSHGNQYEFHDAEGQRPAINYQELHGAIKSNQLEVHFQPIWNLAQARIVGVESLARWNSQALGCVKPDDFVTFAERNDLISELTRWSIHSTLRHASSLLQAGGLQVAINLSPRALARGGVAEQLLDALSIWEIAPTSLIVEITETALARDVESTGETLRRLRDQGVRVSIDDFGIGYASITYLSKFPASELKIDKSLVAFIGSDPHMAKLVESIVKFAHNLDMQATAEGIEDALAQRLLVDMGCDRGQGFHLGRPEPAGDFIAAFAAGAAQGVGRD